MTTFSLSMRFSPDINWKFLALLWLCFRNAGPYRLFYTQSAAQTLQQLDLNLYSLLDSFLDEPRTDCSLHSDPLNCWGRRSLLLSSPSRGTNWFDWNGDSATAAVAPWNYRRRSSRSAQRTACGCACSRLYRCSGVARVEEFTSSGTAWPHLARTHSRPGI